ncbi:transposase [Roseococcus sp. SDR]|uniref:transposase n=1 Tax=Roseococcus sp. SDR TaxID=2835532 RepID=UPI001BCF11FE|nr:transposase [Roseococcus sp. SDR]MBS7789253.1 transposase [Roseococcus sp. SDR]MBV1844567.1 transposase [Roseococcus sp. SDR]
MSQEDQIAAVEAKLQSAGVSVSEVCRRAGIDRATWHRWKREGDKPRAATWARVEAVLAEVLPAEKVAA